MDLFLVIPELFWARIPPGASYYPAIEILPLPPSPYKKKNTCGLLPKTIASTFRKEKERGTGFRHIPKEPRDWHIYLHEWLIW